MNKLDRAYSMVPSVNCKGLCVECCGPVITSDAETARIKQRHSVAVDFDPKTLRCTSLKDDRCSIYADRPLLCRLFGAVEKMPCPFGCAPDSGMMSVRNEDRAMKLAYGE